MWKWDYDPDDLPALSEILIDGQGKKVLSIGGDAVEGFYLKVTTEENKKLIAAAPDMYEALSLIYKIHCEDAFRLADKDYIAITKAAAALALAEGRSTE